MIAGLRTALSLAERGPDAAMGRLHLVSELLLDVATTDSVRSQFGGTAQLEAWRVLADVLPEPARKRAEQMVLWCDLDLPDEIA